MYSGISSVPKISSGSRSRLEKKRRGKHEIANESKKQIKRKLTLEWALLWWSAILLDGLLSLVRHGFGVFSFEQGGEDVK
jgi:hypothetical protein